MSIRSSLGTALLVLWFGCFLNSGALRAATPEPELSESERKAKVEAAVNRLPWIKGPGQSQLGTRAALKYSGDYRFLEAAGAKKYLKMSGNEVDQSDILGMVEQVTDRWWVVFEFENIGYVKDDEKNKLDAEKILKSYEESIAARNESRGGPPTRVVGWHTKPNYNEKTHNLEWALIFENSGSKYVNYKVKLLGRHGVIEGTWVGDLEQLDVAAPAFRQVLNDFSYGGGETYAEYRAGDKVAKYGLGALVLGGAVLGAAKFGLLAKFVLFFKKGIKFVVLGVVALGAWIKKLFTEKKRKDDF